LDLLGLMIVIDQYESILNLLMENENDLILIQELDLMNYANLNLKIIGMLPISCF